MKKIIIIFTIFLSVSLITVLVLLNWWETNTKPVSVNTQQERFVVVKGASAEQVANDLYEQGLIRSPLAFKFYLQMKGDAGRILPGEYDLSPSLSLQEITEQLKRGPDELWVTVPEGLRREQVPGIFVESLGLSDPEAAVFIDEFLDASQDLEGYLFPDTYLFPPDTTGEMAVNRMKSTFDTYTLQLNEDIANSEYSLKEIVTLASILERETRTEDERPVVAGIFYNRLDLGMPLQADATVQYARDNAVCLDVQDCDWWEPVLRGDLQFYESPYNTYTNTEIPPAPIASPGLSSLEAVVYPEDSEYLFYLHDPEGNIHYGESAEEHNQNKARYIDN